jgi:hypothetical protein
LPADTRAVVLKTHDRVWDQVLQNADSKGYVIQLQRRLTDGEVAPLRFNQAMQADPELLGQSRDGLAKAAGWCASYCISTG